MTTQAIKNAMYGQETDEVIVVLLTISHEDIDPPIRICSNSENIESNGNTFIALPFEVTLPVDEIAEVPRAKISIDNIDRSIVVAVRNITTAATVLMEVVLASDPDTIESTFPDFTLDSVSYDQLTVSGELSLENFLQEPYPSASFDPARFPGGF